LWWNLNVPWQLHITVEFSDIVRDWIESPQMFYVEFLTHPTLECDRCEYNLHRYNREDEVIVNP
jgi:hypothetical protein